MNLYTSVKSVVLFGLLFLLAPAALAQEWQNLWPDEAPGAPRPPEGTESIGEGGRYTDIEVPQYMLYRAEKPNGQCMVVLPGGGYRILAMEHEGKQFGEWFNERGITVVLVKYRVTGKDELGYRFPVPQMDARRAIRLARSKAGEWGIDPNMVGVMGFSAGGHLASTCVTMFGDTFPQETSDAIDTLSCRPDFGVLVYPVIAMSKPYGHTGSRNALLGKDPPEELILRCDTSLRVTEKTPPVLVVHAADDGGVPLQNAMDFMAACVEKKVPVTAHIYSSGGHGFGFPGRGEATGWTARLAEWLEKR